MCFGPTQNRLLTFVQSTPPGVVRVELRLIKRAERVQPVCPLTKPVPIFLYLDGKDLPSGRRPNHVILTTNIRGPVVVGRHPSRKNLGVVVVGMRWRTGGLLLRRVLLRIRRLMLGRRRRIVRLMLMPSLLLMPTILTAVRSRMLEEGRVGTLQARGSLLLKAVVVHEVLHPGILLRDRGRGVVVVVAGMWLSEGGILRGGDVVENHVAEIVRRVRVRECRADRCLECHRHSKERDSEGNALGGASVVLGGEIVQHRRSTEINDRLPLRKLVRWSWGSPVLRNSKDFVLTTADLIWLVIRVVVLLRLRCVRRPPTVVLVLLLRRSGEMLLLGSRLWRGRRRRGLLLLLVVLLLHLHVGVLLHWDGMRSRMLLERRLRAGYWQLLVQQREGRMLVLLLLLRGSLVLVLLLTTRRSWLCEILLKMLLGGLRGLLRDPSALLMLRPRSSTTFCVLFSTRTASRRGIPSLLLDDAFLLQTRVQPRTLDQPQTLFHDTVEIPTDLLTVRRRLAVLQAPPLHKDVRGNILFRNFVRPRFHGHRDRRNGHRGSVLSQLLRARGHTWDDCIDEFFNNYLLNSPEIVRVGGHLLPPRRVSTLPYIHSIRTQQTT